MICAMLRFTVFLSRLTFVYGLSGACAFWVWGVAAPLVGWIALVPAALSFVLAVIVFGALTGERGWT